MQKIAYGVGGLLLLAIAVFGLIPLFRSLITPDENRAPASKPPTTQKVVEHTVKDAELGLTFTYRTEPNGYVLETVPATTSSNPDFVKGYMLTLKSDYDELQQATDPREGPPTIQVRAYKNPKKMWATMWTDTHPRESNIELAHDEPVEAVVGGANAVNYVVDGLYTIDTYVVANGSYIFVFTGEYLDTAVPQKADFGVLIRSVAFIPEE